MSTRSKQGLLRRMVRRWSAPPQMSAVDALTPEDRRIVERAMPHTMTSVARIQAVIDAVRYCEERGITGAFAECGVWRGGSVLAMILTLQELGAEPREHLPLRHLRGHDQAGRGGRRRARRLAGHP